MIEVRYTNRLAPVAMALALFATACTGSEAARDVAKSTIAIITANEKQVNDKVIAEKAFYRNEQAALRAYLTGTVNLKSGDKQTLNVTESLVWGRIVNNANRDARLTAEALVNSTRPNVMGVSIAYIQKGVDADNAAYRELAARRTRLRENLLKELAKLDQQKSRLKKAKKVLTKLTKAPDAAGDFNLIKNYADVIKNAIEKLTAKK